MCLSARACETWIHIQAISQGNNESVSTLLQTNHVDLDATDTEGRNALHAAAYVDNAEAINLLVQFGAFVDTIDETGQSALMTAAEMGASAAAEALMHHRCNPALVDAEHKTGKGVPSATWSFIIRWLPLQIA